MRIMRWKEMSSPMDNQKFSDYVETIDVENVEEGIVQEVFFGREV